MKMVIVPAAAVLLAGLAQVVLADLPGNERGNELAAPKPKIVGAWKGETTCAGSFLFRADGTYELTGYGPANDDSAGTWKVRWEALPATLVLTCTTSEIPDHVGKIREVKLIQLDDKSLAVKHANQTEFRYVRVKK